MTSNRIRMWAVALAVLNACGGDGGSGPDDNDDPGNLPPGDGPASVELVSDPEFEPAVDGVQMTLPGEHRRSRGLQGRGVRVEHQSGPGAAAPRQHRADRGRGGLRRERIVGGALGH